MPVPDFRRELATLSRFGLAGLANTGLGLAIILGLELGLGLQRNLANAAGYAAGILLSMVLHRRFVFQGPVEQRGLKTRYLLAMAAAFAINQAVLSLGGQVLPDSDLARTAAQVVALGSYTASQFLLMRLWVFRRRAVD